MVKSRFDTKVRFAVLGVFGLTAILLALFLNMQAGGDTIFYSNSNAIIVLPNGDRIPTNSWFTWGDRADVAFLPIENNEFQLIESTPGNAVASLESSGRTYELIVFEASSRSPGNIRQYWVRPGSEISGVN